MNVEYFDEQKCDIKLVFNYIENKNNPSTQNQPVKIILNTKLSDIHKLGDPSLYTNTTFTYTKNTGNQTEYLSNSKMYLCNLSGKWNIYTVLPEDTRNVTIDDFEFKDVTKSDLQYPRVYNGISLVEKPQSIRHSNTTKVRCEIRYGKDDSVFKLVEVLVDYIKSPQYIRLTQEQLDLTEDTSQMMEFPDYICQEIINELVAIVMENTQDPRLQTHVAVTQSIAQPTQQQAQ